MVALFNLGNELKKKVLLSDAVGAYMSALSFVSETSDYTSQTSKGPVRFSHRIHYGLGAALAARAVELSNEGNFSRAMADYQGAIAAWSLYFGETSHNVQQLVAAAHSLEVKHMAIQEEEELGD